ncbi:hypothetical protein KP509_36G031000 [Ceratopteris richardii]|uniref:Uncharacterized protein n=1 Tax=Ceratopteris richardii TaxID=49495 RepID=A0A8T2QBR8_CERRI|nr:hypothetical protein KP509_36G031000 [Ceratopteris richardii]
MGRAILVNRDVEPGELLIVSKAIAHAKINPFDFSSPLDESGSVRERESMWKTLHDPIVSQVLGRARSSEVFQKQVSGLRLSTHGMDDTIIPSIDLYSRTNKETDMCATAMEEEEISNVLVGDVHLELDTHQINQVAESSSYVGYYLWVGSSSFPLLSIILVFQTLAG